MIDRQDLVKLMDSVLKFRGFNRSGLIWTSDSEELLIVLGLQKSNYDKSWFINIGFWVKELGDPPGILRQEQCHVQARAQELWPMREPSPDELLGESAPISDTERASQLDSFLRNDLVPILQRGTTVESLKGLLVELPGFRTRKVAHELLGVSL